MKVIILYRPDSEQARPVETFAHDFTRLHPQGELELMSVETIEGSRKAELYDITQYPTLLAIDSSGKLLKDWQGEMPLMDDVAFYATQ